MASITGSGNVTITPLKDNLDNPQQPLSQRILTNNSNNDLEWNLNLAGNRIAFQIVSNPNSSNFNTLNSGSEFTMTRFTPYIMTNPMGSIRGI